MKLVFDELNDSGDLVDEVVPLLNQVSTLMLALADDTELDEDKAYSANYFLICVINDVAEALIDYDKRVRK